MNCISWFKKQKLKDIKKILSSTFSLTIFWREDRKNVALYAFSTNYCRVLFIPVIYLDRLNSERFEHTIPRKNKMTDFLCSMKKTVILFFLYSIRTKRVTSPLYRCIMFFHCCRCTGGDDDGRIIENFKNCLEFVLFIRFV